jgi:hypothetical protein
MIKRALWATSLSGLALTAAYMAWQPDYRNWIYQNTLAPMAEEEIGSGRPEFDVARRNPTGKSSSGSTRRKAFQRRDANPRERKAGAPSRPNGAARTEE